MVSSYLLLVFWGLHDKNTTIKIQYSFNHFNAAIQHMNVTPFSQFTAVQRILFNVPELPA